MTVPPSPYPGVMHEGVLDQLAKYTDYLITVLCYTKIGDGPTSPPVAVKTLEDGEVYVIVMKLSFH